MPIYHQLQWTPEITEEIRQRPIDGVRPQDHPETYAKLTELRCVKQARGSIYQNTENFRKICQECYDKIPAREQYMTLPPHNIVHKDSVDNQTSCTKCDIITALVKPAKECIDCIEEFLYVDHEYLAEGWGQAVFPRGREGQ